MAENLLSAKPGGDDAPECTPSSSTSTSSTRVGKRGRTVSEQTREAVTPQDEDATSQFRTSTSAWKGWAELENDPVIFTTLLREWGIRNVVVNEVIPLDAIFEKSLGKVLGMVFLSRWTPSETDIKIIEPPDDLWFANQISTFSCASLALLNIVNNLPNLDLGPHLNEFRQSTVSLPPKDRGIAVDGFNHVRSIHNSFATELDCLTVDMRLKEEVQAEKQKSAKRRKGRRRKRHQSDDDDESGFHFIAYVAAHGQVWKLDGLERKPRSLGLSDCNGDSWLMSVYRDVQAQMEVAEASGVEFSLLSLTLADGPGSNINTQEIERMREDWAPFIAQMLRVHVEKGDLATLLA